MSDHDRAAIETARKFASQGDYPMALYMLRDLAISKEAGLSDLLWAAHQYGFIVKRDWEDIIEQLEGYIENTRLKGDR
jgi:hypothetical protein